MFVTLETFQELMLPLNDEARRNMAVISVTLETSQELRSPLNDEACMNMRL